MIYRYFVILLVFPTILSCQSKDASTFKDKQLRYPRVQRAMLEKYALLRHRFSERGLLYPPQQIFIRVFKQEKRVEVWAYSAADARFEKVCLYPICRTSGILGPKRREGDLQIPEGFYYFEKHRNLPKVLVRPDGTYQFSARPLHTINRLR